jgi:heme-degrading monooxygenase HmoA
MYAALHRFEGASALSEAIVRAANRLAARLSRQDGFVSFALLEVGERIGISITIFETRAELEAADADLVTWAAEHLAGWLAGPPQITSGEVVVQRGM